MDFLFDIGRVLLDFDFEVSMRRLVHNESDDLINRLMIAVEDRNALESGREDADAFIKRSIESIDSNISEEDFRAAWRGVFVRNAPMWDVVRALKAAGGHRLILFSNTNAIHCPWFFGEYPEFGMFDGAVLSYEVGVMKPDGAIYRHAIREFGLDPARTRYVDDLAANVATGERFGFRCHLYDLRRHDRFERWLADELGSGA